MARYDLSEAEWRLIEPLLPNKPRGVARVDDRRVLNGIFWTLRTGSPWRDLPERYGPYTTIYNRYNRWAKAGVWLRIFETLAERSPGSLDLIDSSIVRAHQHAAGGKKGGEDHAIGRSRGGLSTKIHVVEDAVGLPVRLLLTPGQASDKTTLPDLVAGLRPGARSDCRSRLQRPLDHRALRDPWSHRPHPQPEQCAGGSNRRSPALSATQPRRALLQQTQAP